MTKVSVPTQERGRERTLLVIFHFKHERDDWMPSDVLYEMEELVKTSGGQVVDSIICRIDKISARSIIGEGKLEEIAQLCAQKKVETVIFSHDLKGSQQRNIEEVVQVKTIDRTQLILDIFAKHATSKEGKMQVELAQLEYLLPRLVGRGIELSRLGGGIGTLGPGETKLEMDRRKIGQRITRLKRELENVAASRAQTRKQRKKKGLPLISLVGYTNAGKSTLLNTLTAAQQKTQEGLFTTLDSLARQLMLPNHQKVVLSDTVGFMHALPHDLIEAFKATLEEVREADLLLHVLDVSHENFRQIYDSVRVVLRELGAAGKPTLVVLNKIDKVAERDWLKNLEENFDPAVSISAKEKIHIDRLLEKIQAMLSVMSVEINIHIPIQRMDLVNLAHEEGEVLSVKYYNDRIHLRAVVPSQLAGKFIPINI